MKGTIITILALLSASADAASITTLKRTSNWQLSYDERSCDLAATFGADSEQIFVMFSRYGPSDWFNLTVAGPIAKTSRLISDITVDFGPVENPRRVRGLNGTVGSLPSTSITNLRLDDAEFQEDESELPGIKEEDEAKVDTVRLILRAKRVVQLQLGSMAKPMLAIRNCTDGLMKLWGLNPEEQKKPS